MIDWLGQLVGVYGYGKTGRACVEYLLPRMITPSVLIDSLDTEREQALRRDAAGRFELVVGENIPEVIERLDSLILSPGVPMNNTNVQRARQRGILVTSELELAARYCPGHILAVTGTNGKSTTTKMLGHVLSALGPAHTVGNIGEPLLGELELIGEGDYVALEVSSFQLEAVDSFAPHVAIYTNLTPDHLNRHGTMEEYARVKHRMVERMRSDGFVITNALCEAFAPSQFANQQPTFLEYRSTPGLPLRGAWASNGLINVDLGNELFKLSQDCIKLPGVHNLENALAVILAALLMGATPETISERLSSFTGYEHRLEKCREHDGISFYNDSKATNPEATVTALRAMEAPLALILGGRDKMTDLTEMVNLIKRKVRAVVLYGEAADRFAASLAGIGYNRYTLVDDLAAAVPAAVKALKPAGGTVLLSPACASFDQYGSYEERGEHFKGIVAGL